MQKNMRLSVDSVLLNFALNHVENVSVFFVVCQIIKAERNIDNMLKIR